jgi:hypothetical protein
MTSRASKRKEWLEQETEQAILESTIDAVLSQASQGTPEMRKALLEMKELLKCSLCKCIYVDPVSLAACGHSFCRKCIENHNCDNAHCPGKCVGINSFLNYSFLIINLRMRVAGQHGERKF